VDRKSDYRDVWILAEQSGGRIQSVTHELLNWGGELARARGCGLSAMVFGDGVAQEDLEELIARGAERVVVTEAPELERFLVESHAACMVEVIAEYRPEVIIAGATTTGRTLMPYVAVRVGTGLTADCTGLSVEEGTGNLLQTRPAIGGNVLATIKTADHRPQMATVRPRSKPPAEKIEGRTGQIVRRRARKELLTSRMRFIETVCAEGEQPLVEADIVVSAGRGIQRGQNVDVVGRLASALGGALGASRDVVDRGWLSYPHQGGLSGKTVSPRLYVAVGISGAIQHLAGMQTAETVVAINKDPEAQIFKVADFGIVGDLFEVLPALVEQIDAARSEA